MEFLTILLDRPPDSGQLWLLLSIPISLFPISQGCDLLARKGIYKNVCRRDQEKIDGKREDQDYWLYIPDGYLMGT